MTNPTGLLGHREIPHQLRKQLTISCLQAQYTVVQTAEKSAKTAHQLTRGVCKKSGGSREGGVASEGSGSLHMEKSLNMVGRMSMHSKMILTACWQKSSPRWDRYRLQKNVVVHELAV
jgi:hypothetical protein